MPSKKISALTELTTEPADDDVFPAVDTSVTTTKKVKWQTLKAPLMSITNWIADANTWSYSSADSPTFVISVNADMTGMLQAGMRIKLTQTTAKYFIITVVGSYSGGATLITVYGGTDYTLANAAITSPYYSAAKAPFGFPMDPAKWMVSLSDTSDREQLSPTSSTVYNLGSLSLSIPIGVWNVTMEVACWAVSNAAQTAVGMHAALSTANNSISDNNMRGFAASIGASATLAFGAPVHFEKTLNLASKTTYYPVAVTYYSNIAAIRFYNSSVKPLTVTCVCAYL